MSDKIYDVPAEWRKRAFVDDAKYKEMYDRSIKDPNGFWAEQAKRIDWIKPFSKVKNTSYDPHNVSIKWFEDGTLNACYNCVDRHLAKRGDQTAILWEGDDPKDDKKLTYKQLHAEVCRFANVLKARGVKKGDRVTIYMPMIPEAAVSMLACARIGAIHSVIFGGFSPDSIAGRIEDCKSTVHRHRRRGRARRPQDSAQGQCRRGLRQGRRRHLRHRGQAHQRSRQHGEGPRRLLRRHRQDRAGRLPVRGDEARRTRCSSFTPRARPASRRACCTPPAAIWSTPRSRTNTCSTITTATSTGAPPTSAGSPATATSSMARSRNGAISMMFEGVPNYPTTSRFWEVCDKHKVNIIYTAPTAHPRADAGRRRSGEEDLAQIACACSAPSASRSIRKPGSGTTTWSARTAARSSIPGGRPRPAAF